MLCIDNKKMDNILETKKTKKGRLSTEHIKSTEAGYKEPTEDQKAGLNHIRK